MGGRPGVGRDGARGRGSHKQWGRRKIGSRRGTGRFTDRGGGRDGDCDDTRGGNRDRGSGEGWGLRAGGGVHSRTSWIKEGWHG